VKWTKSIEEFDEMFSSVKTSVEMECGDMSLGEEQLIKEYFFTDMSKEEFYRKAVELTDIEDVDYHLEY
jgi:hypothetical protein